MANNEREGIKNEARREDSGRSSEFWSSRIRTEKDVIAQKEWQSGGTPAERRVKNFYDQVSLGLGNGENKLQMPAATGMPESDAFAHELARAIMDDDYEPEGDWEAEINRLRRVKTDQGELDVLKLLADPSIPVSIKQQYWQKEVSGIFAYCWDADMARLSDARKIEHQEEGFSDPLNNEELPPTEENEMRTSMDEMGEGEGEPKGYFSVHPFYGGYYREEIFERHVRGSKWAKSARNRQEAPAGEVQDGKIMRGKAIAGKITPLPMPYGFRPDQSSLQSEGGLKLLMDEAGNYVLDATNAKDNRAFTLMIGKAEKNKLGKEPDKMAVSQTYMGKEASDLVRGLFDDDSTLVKARKIKSFVRGLLTYSNESKLNAVYETHPRGYFAGIEEYKQADCDVANAYYINLLSAAGIKARMAVGHYVKNKDSKGAAVLGSGTRHAWTEVWDELGREWVRFDATPPHDPTLDEDRPDELPEDEAKEGDFGEQEAVALTDEQLEELRLKLKELGKQAQLANESPERKKDREFAREAGCDVEEAAQARRKIEAARKLKDSKGRIIRDRLATEFQKIVESNFKPREIFKGPVKRSEGDEVDDLVTIGKELLSGERDPLGYKVSAQEMIQVQEYGGFDLYLVVDRSGSMKEIDSITNTPKKDEQQLAVFSILDSMHAFAEKTRMATARGLLQSPLSVKSALIAFQSGGVSSLKDLSGSWSKKEQYDCWKGLESNIGGGTPAHLGLEQVRESVERDIAEEEKHAKKTGRRVKKRLRMVMAFMDGGVDDKEKYLAELKSLEAFGVYVTSWGMTESARAVEAFPGGHCVASVRDIIEPVAKEVIDKAQKLKLKK